MRHADVVVVGPGAVTGPETVDPELVRTALDAVDDRLAVYDDRIVTVRELWGRVVDEALGERHDRVTLVVPSWWPGSRVELVEDALLTLSAVVTVLRRGEVLRTLAPVVVELGPGAPSVDEVLESCSGAATVVLDTPTGVGGLDAVALDVERRLERRGVEVIRVDDDGVRGAAGTDPQRPRPRWRPARVGVIACALTIAAALAGAALRPEPTRSAPATTWVVEGRVAVEVPANWAVERVVTGPGSARLQVMSPDGGAAVHITQAVVAPLETRDGTARALGAALQRQPAGVFTDFNPDDVVAGRHAVSYREVRSGVVDWTALVDGGVRIAIGCRDGSTEPRRTAVCERAIGSARTLGEIG
ncbi:type VII secretion-associated protein [Mycolicibacterium arenosum]|uniref:Type VII secretion-associated protein n=1 Tax=Mycolicibacterium arenosum TaxID=2952157 RepID=A0ABT1M8J1_9MYCO|nr:type VII secretion-associated protein [Mycolicibacterium sp. CAU 1645]MCP9275478.1 type VII secretion-associated protein [Mycolicibacterium sp. CAU 1645]